MTDIRIKRAASVPDTIITLTRPDDAPGPLAGATITMKARHQLQGITFQKTLSVEDYETAQVKIDWGAEETALLTAGVYDAEIWVSYPDDETIILPVEGYYTLEILENLNV